MRWPAAALVVVWLVTTTVGPTASIAVNDLGVYRGYADAVLGGAVPYRDFDLEYPPLALVPMVLAGVLGTGPHYEWAFGALMLLAMLAVQREVALLSGRRAPAAAWLLVALPVAAGAIVRVRYDLFAVALALIGLRLVLQNLDDSPVGQAAAASARRRVVPGGVVLGLGVATKLFPGLVAGALLAWLVGVGRRADALRLGGAVALTVVMVCAPFMAVAPAGLVRLVTFHVERPVQIESTPASVLWMVGQSEVSGRPERPDRFKSHGLVGAPAAEVAAAGALLQVAVLVVVLILTTRAARAQRGCRQPARRLPRARPQPQPRALAVQPPDATASVRLAPRAAVAPRYDAAPVALAAPLALLLAFVALGKVLSPQFLLWLAPLAAVAWTYGLRAPAALVAAAVVLTQVEFPARYWDLVHADPLVIALVAVRNALLLAALSLLVARLAGWARSGRPVDASSTG